MSFLANGMVIVETLMTKLCIMPVYIPTLYDNVQADNKKCILHVIFLISSRSSSVGVSTALPVHLITYSVFVFFLLTAARAMASP